MAFEIGTKVVSGRKAVTAAGTAERFVSESTKCFVVYASADAGNSGSITIGNSTTIATSGSQRGATLFPGNPAIPLYVDDVYKLYVDAEQNGDAVCFTYLVQ